MYYIWPQPNTAYQHKYLIPNVKQSVGWVRIFACSTAMGPRHLAVFESTMNSSVYQNILESKERPSVRQLNFV